MSQTAVIIGAGPAGLTAAYELCARSDIRPVVLEASGDIGGISKTAEHNGNRIDIGGHRFFSRSDEVMQWWNSMLPVQASEGVTFNLRYQGGERDLEGAAGADPDVVDDVMLVRSRLSRIYYGRQFYDYPITLSWGTVRNLGVRRMAAMGLSYVKARLRPLPERSLEEFYVNRFGRELYNTFFRDYTEKVWGTPCSEIAPDWGAQRVKGLSITGTLKHAAKKVVRDVRAKLGQRRGAADLSQKDTEVSLIEYFLYPKFGPGQLWQKVAREVESAGGEVRLHHRVVGIEAEPGRVRGVRVRDDNGDEQFIEADYVFSTMAVKDLIEGFEGVDVPDAVREVASGLPYRDFITVGLLLDKLLLRNETDRVTRGGVVPDNWIYIQEPDVKVGRLQIFNNWSPYMVADPDKVWIGMEYFVNEGDELWTSADDDMVAFGVRELASIGVIDPADVRDGCVIRVPKTYPAYFGTYERFDEVRRFTDSFDNLFLVGRNGQHRYNNQDHSMLTAIRAVDAIIAGDVDKDAIWNVNVEAEYHESTSS